MACLATAGTWAGEALHLFAGARDRGLQCHEVFLCKNGSPFGRPLLNLKEYISIDVWHVKFQAGCRLSDA